MTDFKQPFLNAFSTIFWTVSSNTTDLSIIECNKTPNYYLHVDSRTSDLRNTIEILKLASLTIEIRTNNGHDTSYLLANK